MKKVIAAIFCMCMSFSMCACVRTDSKPYQKQVTYSETETETKTETALTTAETTTETTTVSETAEVTTEAERKAPSLRNKYSVDDISLSSELDVNSLIGNLNPEKFREINVICSDGIEQGEVRVIYIWDDPHCKEKDPSTLTANELTQDVVDLYINNSDKYVVIDGPDSSGFNRTAFNVIPPHSVNSGIIPCRASDFNTVREGIFGELYAYELTEDTYEKVKADNVNGASIFPPFEQYKTVMSDRYSLDKYKIDLNDFWSATLHFYGIAANSIPYRVNILYLNDNNQLVCTTSNELNNDNKVENIYNVDTVSGYGFATKTLVLVDYGTTP